MKKKNLIILIVLIILGTGGFLAYKYWWVPRVTVPQKTDCDWRPTKDYGQCEMEIGVYYNGEKCVYISGCKTPPEIPFSTLEECKILCKKEEVSKEEEEAAPCSWVFKTKGDYYNLVYGFVYDDRSKFAILPSANLKARPDKLNNGYFTINHGCSLDYLNYPFLNPRNFVFCNITYEKWGQIGMGEDLLIPLIIDEPFEELYFCGEDSSFLGTLSVEKLNEIINNNELSTRCEKIEN